MGWSESRYFNGIIDEVAIHVKRLSDQAIHQHYISGLAGLSYFSYSMEGLRGTIEPMNLEQGIQESLMKKVEAASNAFEKRLYKSTVNILDALINEVEALRGKKITEQQREELVRYAEGLRQLILQL